jgi:hypothetical protein
MFCGDSENGFYGITFGIRTINETFSAMKKFWRGF